RADREASRARRAETGERTQKQQALAARDEALRQRQAALAQRRIAETQRGIAEEKTAESKRRLGRVKVTTGLQLAQAGDPLRALLFLAEARSLEAKERRRDSVHALRQADVLSHIPPLLYLDTVTGQGLPTLGFTRGGSLVMGSGAATPHGLLVWDP